MNTAMSRRELLAILPICGHRSGTTSGEELYVVTACPQPYGDMKFPALMFCLGPDGRHVRWATELVTADQGVDFVLYSCEARYLVAAGPKSTPANIVAVALDAPGRPRSALLDLHGLSVVRRHLVWIDNHLCLAIQEYAEGKQQFIAIRLDDLSTQIVGPRRLYGTFAIDGDPGGLILDRDFAYLEQFPGSRLLMVAEAMPRFPSSIVLPHDIVFAPKDLVRLCAINRDVIVLTSGESSVWKGFEGHSVFQVQDRRKNSWQSVNVPGGPSAVRAFGEWLAFHIRYNLAERPNSGATSSNSYTPRPSPGRDHRRQRSSATGAPFDWAADFLRVYQPGLIYLYNVPTGRRIIKDTGQGDTEVLLVRGDRVLYRCDRILYEARITGGTLNDPSRLLEKDFIADVHWAFYGPPAGPPSDPPWKAFDLERLD